MVYPQGLAAQDTTARQRDTSVQQRDTTGPQRDTSMRDSIAAEAGTRVDSLSRDSLRADSAQRDTLRIDDDSLRTGRFLHRIEVGKLDTALTRITREQAVDSLVLAKTADTLSPGTLRPLYRKNEARINRLHGYRDTASDYQTVLETAMNRLDSIDRDSAVATVAEETLDKADSVDRLLVRVDTALLSALLLKDRLLDGGADPDSSQLTTAGRYIWSSPRTLNRKTIVKGIRENFRHQDTIAHYFTQSDWGNRLLLVLIAVAFCYWVAKVGEGSKRQRITVGLAETAIVLLALLPIFAIDTPSIVIQASVLAQLLVLSLLLRKRTSYARWQRWALLLGFYVLTVVANSIAIDDIVLRLMTIALNLAAIYLSLRLRPRDGDAAPEIPIPSFVLYAFIGMNVGATVVNILGYMPLARLMSIAAAVGLGQYVTLSAFIRIVRGALDDQFARSAQTKGFFSRFNKQRTLIGTNRALYLVSVLSWLIVLAINLRLIGPLASWTANTLATERNIGSITFTAKNVLVFLLIIAIANWLQKNVALFFTGRPVAGYTPLPENRGSLVALFRLIVIVLGFLIAVSALGIGMDKLTVILGALSVGVGLGLQNIFNNFVSGVILIFERPFRIGDYVELADKKGRVQAIGIRSSTLATQEGAEVVIPNGDLLSGRLVNWTLTKSYMKSSVTVKVGRNADLDRIRQLITEEVKQIAYTQKKTDVEILLQATTADAVTLQVNSWIIHIYNENVFKSQLRERLNTRFLQEGIDLLEA